MTERVVHGYHGYFLGSSSIGKAMETLGVITHSKHFTYYSLGRDHSSGEDYSWQHHVGIFKVCFDSASSHRMGSGKALGIWLILGMGGNLYGCDREVLNVLFNLNKK